MHSNR